MTGLARVCCNGIEMCDQIFELSGQVDIPVCRDGMRIGLGSSCSRRFVFLRNAVYDRMQWNLYCGSAQWMLECRRQPTLANLLGGGGDMVRASTVKQVLWSVGRTCKSEI
jgi:hypothetical protein